MVKSCILFILHLPPPVHGAAMVGKYIHNSELINSEFDCHYINLTTASSLEDIGQVGWHKVKTFCHLLQEIRRSVKELKPDLVYVTPNAKGGAFYKDFIVVIMLKWMGCRVVAHYHNKGVFTWQDRWIDNLLYRLFFKDLKVILLAEALYKDVEKYVKRENVLVCPNGIPVLPCQSYTERNNNTKLRLLFLSNLLISKGVLVLFDALKILKNKGFAFICDFVGGETSEIDAKRFNEEVKKRELKEFVIYQGRKYGKEKDEYFEHADIFVFPTYYHNECFPLVLLEAMQHGLPCISTTEGGISGIIDDGQTGFVVEKRNASVLAEKLEFLLTDETLRHRMGKAGRIKFEQNFTLSKFEQKFCETLKSCL